MSASPYGLHEVPGELVPGARHRAGERGSHRWQERSRRHPGRAQPMRQWMLRITAYAERLLNDLEAIGLAAIRSRRCSGTGSGGARARSSYFRGCGWRHRGERTTDRRSAVFTTRPDTLFGATYMVLSPEHPLVREITHRRTARRGEAYHQRESPRRVDLERTELAKEKTGVFTGAYADQSGQRREDSDLDRRLRAGELRHRRDHGGAGT